MNNRGFGVGLAVLFASALATYAVGCDTTYQDYVAPLLNPNTAIFNDGGADGADGADGGVQGRVGERGGLVDGGALFDQQAQDVGFAIAGGHLERRQAGDTAAAPKVDAVVQQYADHVEVAALDGTEERRVGAGHEWLQQAAEGGRGGG